VPGLVHIFVFFILLAIFEGSYRKYKNMEKPFNETREIITRDEFDDKIFNGEELVLLDDLVLDISKFKTEHPGGRFLLEHNISRDISKFFYGGYSMEPEQGIKPVRHSNIARAIVNDLIVGRLIEKA
jgi:cytochrome b involved in lipid metabolism